MSLSYKRHLFYGMPGTFVLLYKMRAEMAMDSREIIEIY